MVGSFESGVGVSLLVLKISRLIDWISKCSELWKNIDDIKFLKGRLFFVFEEERILCTYLS